MARKGTKSNRWIKSHRVGEVTLFLTIRSPYWQMYWAETQPGLPANLGGRSARPREFTRSTRETDFSLAALVAAKHNEELVKRRLYPESKTSTTVSAPALMQSLIDEFDVYLKSLNRSHGHARNIHSRLCRLASWMEARGLRHVQDVTPKLLGEFTAQLQAGGKMKAATINHYVDAVHNFFGYVIFKRRSTRGPNPAATGRQAELDRLPYTRLPPPTLYPDQINAVIEAARRRHDHQIVNLIVFVCEGGFRFEELQFLQVGDIDLERREIRLDIKRPDFKCVRPELQRRCLTAEGIWIPKTRASRRPVHISDRLAKVLGSMGLGQPSDWVFANSVGNQIAENKTLLRLKAHALAAGVLVEVNPRTKEKWSTLRWHWLRHYHRTRAHVSRIRREVSKVAMGHAADAIHDHYRGLDEGEFHREYEKFDSGIDLVLLEKESA